MCTDNNEQNEGSNEEQKALLIKEIKELFSELLQEPKGRNVPGGGYGYVLDPNSDHYCMIAKKLINKAFELYALGYHVMPQYLQATLYKEIEYVNLHNYKYDKNGNPTNKSKDDLIALMDKANHQLRLDLYEILKDVKL